MIVTNDDGSKSITPEAREEIAQGLPSRLFGYERMEHALVNSAQFHAITTFATLFGTSTTVLAASGGVAMVYGAIYGLLALKRVFGDSWPRTIGKAAAVASVYMAGLFGASLVVIAITLALI